MTLNMHERYHYTFSGIKRYAINRGLRIYPQYWLVCILALLFIGLISRDFASTIHPALRLPQTTHEIISNIFIFGLYPESIQPMARLAPQAWVEITQLP